MGYYQASNNIEKLKKAIIEKDNLRAMDSASELYAAVQEIEREKSKLESLASAYKNERDYISRLQEDRLFSRSIALYVSIILNFIAIGYVIYTHMKLIGKI